MSNAELLARTFLELAEFAALVALIVAAFYGAAWLWRRYLTTDDEGNHQ